MKALLCIALLGVNLCCIAQEKIQLTDQPIRIDGSVSEWPHPLTYFDQETGLFFSVAQDTANLYLCFQTRDELNQLKIMRGGMKVTFKRKNKSQLIYAYPLPLLHDPLPVGDDNLTQADYARLRRYFYDQHKLMRIEGNTQRSGIHRVAEINNAQVAWDSLGYLNYELAVPLLELLGREMDPNLQVIVEISALPDFTKGAQKKSSTPYFSATIDAGTGGMVSAGGGVTAGTAEEARRPSLFEKSELRQKFILNLP